MMSTARAMFASPDTLGTAPSANSALLPHRRDMRHRSVDDVLILLATNLLSQWPALEKWPTSVSPSASGQRLIAPEILHDYRVETRRLRTLIDVFAPWIKRRWARSLRKALRNFAHALGPARDADVFVGTTLASLQQAHRSFPWQAVFDQARAQQAERHRHAIETISSDSHTQLKKRLMRAFGIDTDGVGQQHRARALKRRGRAASKTPRSLARRAKQQIRQRYEDVVTQTGQLTMMSPDALHRLRVCIKHAHYTTATLSPWIKTSLRKRYLATLSDTQDCLGELHDDAVAQQDCSTWPLTAAKRAYVMRWLDARITQHRLRAAQIIAQLPSRKKLEKALRQA